MWSAISDQLARRGSRAESFVKRRSLLRRLVSLDAPSTMSPMTWRRMAVIALAAGVAATILLAVEADNVIELQLRDRMLRLLPRRAATTTAIVAIDEDSLRSEGAWPWPRQKIAELVQRIAAGGARGVALDVILADARSGDEQLAAALRLLPAVVVAAVDERGEWLLPAPSIRNAAVVAHGIFELDQDGIVRRLAATKQSQDRALAALSIEAASIVRPLNIAVGRVIIPGFRTPPASIPVISASTLLHGGNSSLLRGRIAFVGPTALAFGDRVLTPTSGRAGDRRATAATPDSDLGPVADPGVTVHAAATESLVRGEEIRDLPPLAGGASAAIAVACILATASSRRKRLIATAALVVVVIGSAIFLLAGDGIAIPTFLLLSSIIVTAAILETLHINAFRRQSHAAALRLEQNLGVSRNVSPDDVAPRLNEIAEILTSTREREAESKRILAHELRTPLASMRGLSQLLGGYTLTDAERQRVAALLETEAGKLQSIVHSLLDLERLPLRDFSTSTTVVDLSDVVAARIDFLRASTDRQIELNVTGSAPVRGDAALIDRVIDNLVGNALKYTPPPAPVTVRVTNIGGRATLEVEDRGPGIAEADRERIFQRFFRGVTAAGSEGLGLGLSFVAEIARWHGGSADVGRGAVGGAIFRVTFPVATTMAKAGAM